MSHQLRAGLLVDRLGLLEQPLFVSKHLRVVRLQNSRPVDICGGFLLHVQSPVELGSKHEVLDVAAIEADAVVHVLNCLLEATSLNVRYRSVQPVNFVECVELNGLMEIAQHNVWGFPRDSSE